MLNKVRENIIEITMVYSQLLLADAIMVSDSTDGKQTICELAEKFEEIHKDTDWDVDGDYLTDIENYAKEELLKQYPAPIEKADEAAIDFCIREAIYHNSIFKHRIQDVLNRAKQLVEDGELKRMPTEDEAGEIAKEFLNNYDCNVNENSQINNAIQNYSSIASQND